MSNESLDLQVPGFKVSQQETQKPVLRAIWYVMFVVCSFVSLRMIVERVNYYFTYPTMLTYALNKEMYTFPKITFCPSFATFHLNGLHQRPIYSALNGCGNPYEIANCNRPEFWTSHPSVCGTAYTFNYGKANISRLYSAFFELSNERDFLRKYLEESSVKLLLHEDDDDIAYGCLTSAIDIDPYTLLQISFTTEMTIYENVPTRPCQSQRDYRKCQRKCLDENFINILKTNCRLEFMTEVKHLPLCKSVNKNKTIMGINYLMEHMEVDDCECVKACDNLRFVLSIDTDEQQNTTAIWIELSLPNDVEVLRERMSYTGYSLLCEVGGIIGFYLGACLITFIQLLQLLSTRLFAHVTAPKGKPYVRKHMAHAKDCPCCNQPLPTAGQEN